MKDKISNLLFITSCVILIFAGIVILHTLRRIYVFDQFIIPTSSMEPTLIPGDRIIVNKLIIGARIYKEFDFSPGAPLICKRTKGRRKVQVNDVVVFNHPYGNQKRKIGFRINYVCAKRCIGTPGDTVSINNGYYLNKRYGDVIGNSGQQQAFSKITENICDSRAWKTSWLSYIDTRWNTHDMGPLYIPRKGDTIIMDRDHYLIYGYIIEYETGYRCRYKNDSVRLEGHHLESYTFRHNYYYFCGDNIANSNDSRNWGFVPEDFIIGVADRISYSKDQTTGRYIKNRFMKRIK
jgi:signal peptidase I